jgi:hypothetical protein
MSRPFQGRYAIRRLLLVTTYKSTTGSAPIQFWVLPGVSALLAPPPGSHSGVGYYFGGGGGRISKLKGNVVEIAFGLDTRLPTGIINQDLLTLMRDDLLQVLDRFSLLG